MEKLFAVVVGGYPPGAHVEVHDVRFAIGTGIAEIFPLLKAAWWGGDDRFHVDAWGELTWCDGHDIVIGDGPEPDGADASARLWYVQLGGYDPAVFGELHRDVFVVAPSQAEAKSRALSQAKGWAQPHRDTLTGIEAAVDVGHAIGRTRRIHLVPGAEPKPFRFEARYLPRPP